MRGYLFLAVSAIAICRAVAIFSGTNVAFQDYPFFATVVLSTSYTFTGNVWVCGSSLVHESYVLTAAHCTRNAVAAFIYLNSSVSLNPWIPGPAFYSTDITTNPAYSPVTIYNDLGMIKLPSPSPNIPKLNVATSPATWDNIQTCSLVDVLGRGMTCGGGCLSNILKMTQLPKVPYEDCVSPDYHIPTRWAAAVIGNDLCLGHENSCLNKSRTEETCQGDSGGPGFVGNTLVGVVSRGPNAPCGSGGMTSIFANVADAANKQFITSMLPRSATPNETANSTANTTAATNPGGTAGPPRGSRNGSLTIIVLTVVVPVLVGVAALACFLPC
jgi:secreted trypsin-like serine protease